MAEPKKIQAGTTADWDRSIDTYNSSDGYGAQYVLSNESKKYTITATLDTSGLVEVDATPTVTNGWVPGTYKWFLYATKSGEKHLIDQGFIEVTQNPLAADGHDYRSHWRRGLDAIQSLLAGKADAGDYSSLTITTSNGSRSLSTMSFEELIAAESQYKQRVKDEEAEEALNNGQTGYRKIYTRFTG